MKRGPQRITWDPVQAEKGGYRHFMLKEIHEQPRAVRDTLARPHRPRGGRGPSSRSWARPAEELKRAKRVMLLACGTSWHAALVGKYLLEQVAQVPAEVDYGSEFRYRTPLVGPQSLCVAITQSGETADTLAAFREAKRLGALPIAICNVQGSMITREAAGTLLTHAGPEIGVASTKAFTAQIVALALLALHLGRLRGTLTARALPRAPGEPGPGAAPHGERAGHERAHGRGGQVAVPRAELALPRAAASTTRSRSKARSR